jgi:Xaa-Pro aminopeptidase
MTLRQNENPDDDAKQGEPETVEGGFGTGLRAQLRKRLHPELVEETPPEPVEEPEPEFVNYDFEQPATVELNGSNPEVEDLRSQLEAAQKREVELRGAFAEQVEAYERRLSEEYEVAHEQTKLDERSARLSGTESQIREREQRLEKERQELLAERKRLSALQEEVAAAQSAAAELEEELQARDAELTEYDVQHEFSRLMRTEGLHLDPGEAPLCAVNGNAGNPHYSPTAERHSPVRKGDLLLLDFSAPMPGDESVVADYTWMTYLDAEVPERVASLFAIIRDARDVGIALLRERFEAGKRVEGWKVDDAVRAVIQAAGYGDAFVHRTGHNIGTQVHGNGAHLDDYETHDTRPLLINTCTSVEPGIYLPEQGLGLRTEVDVLLLEGGIEVTGVPAQTEVIPLLR